MQTRLFHLHAVSALHCGVGQSADIVDLPIARARATKLPIVPGSSLRGVLRQHVAGGDAAAARTLFGPRTIRGDADSFAGALAVGDAQLLLLPVRCLAGIVAFATSPFILRRYARDLARAGIPAPDVPVPAEGEARVVAGSVNRVDGKLVLEDVDLSAREDADTQVIATQIARIVHPDDESQRDLAARFVLLPDDIMGFLAEHATEVRARVALDPKTGTVHSGALWYEESLPAETVLWGIYALAESNNADDSRPAEALAGCLPDGETLLQLGGNAGVGHGLVRFLADQPVDDVPT